MRLLYLGGFAVLLLSPLGLALLLTYVRAPGEAAPVFLIVAGVLWSVAAFRAVKGLAQEIGDEKGVPEREAFSTVDGSEILARRPLAMSLVPLLVTAGWMLILTGVVWLGFVNLIAAALAGLALVALDTLSRRQRRR